MATKPTRARQIRLKVTVTYERIGFRSSTEHFYEGKVATSGFLALTELWPLLDLSVPSEPVVGDDFIHLHEADHPITDPTI